MTITQKTITYAEMIKPGNTGKLEQIGNPGPGGGQDCITDEPIYWLVTNDNGDYVACGHIAAGQITTGQASLEIFKTVDELNARLTELRQPKYKTTPDNGTP